MHFQDTGEDESLNLSQPYKVKDFLSFLTPYLLWIPIHHKYFVILVFKLIYAVRSYRLCMHLIEIMYTNAIDYVYPGYRLCMPMI